ncbi:MAG TPA: D-sedoheptulose 7-phosphate isomerase [Candidatus Saccharimonadaceae bacterium]|nr:D-sedoheptulose 7-phosphate isomerase [Candidatus Saccharimonadaceae bacterium]
MSPASRSQRGPLERAARALLADSSRSMARLERAASRALAAAADAAIECLESGGTVFFCGNGGSAADAQHLAAELSGRYLMDRPPLAVVALTTNTSALTAIGNDFGFDQVFSRQLEGLATPGDVLVAISTSGGSRNVTHAVEVAHARGMTVIGMTGARGTRFAASCDHALVSPTASTPRIQEGHIAMGHALCELIERALFAQRPAAVKRGAAKRARGSAKRRGAAKRGGKRRGGR